MTRDLRRNAVPRAIIWAFLAGMSPYIGIRLAAGPGRDISFDAVTWTTSAVLQVLAITAAFTAFFAFAAYRTYVREIKAPQGEVIRFPGAMLNLFGDTFLAAVGGALLLVGMYLVTRVPEAILASNHPNYRNYHSASLMSALGPGAVMAFFGFLLMILRRKRWEFRPGQTAVRYGSHTFGRARPVPRDIMLYWERYYGLQGNYRVPVAWCLHGAVDKRRGFELLLVDLETPQPVLDHILGEWRHKLTTMTAGHHQFSARTPYDDPSLASMMAIPTAPS